MNKLFIIGNGFDLSLGLKTKYEDFLCWLVKRELKMAHEKLGACNSTAISQNSLLSAKFRSRIHDADNKLFNVSNIKELKRILSQHPELFEIQINNQLGLFDRIYTQSSKKWVDIELEYFSLLKYHAKTVFETLEKPDPRNSRHSRVIDPIIEKVEKLNNELKALGEYLVEYLKEVNAQPISADVILKHQEKFSSDAEMTYFLNFNYTNTLNTVLKGFQGKHHINHIHGSIDNDIIFGYGDEMDKNYKLIEELNENLFFEHIKSFGYFKKDNYSNLLSFLSSGKYEVCIYGHSCGLSDRVMLKEIFEHKNCLSVN